MRIYLWQLLRTFLKLQGVCFRDDTMTLQQYNIIISIMATIQEKLDETIKNQEAQKALFTEAFSEINAKLQEFVVKQGEYVEQIKALQAQIAAGTIGPEVLVTLDKVLANSQQNVIDAKALADIVPNPETPPSSGSGQ